MYTEAFFELYFDLKMQGKINTFYQMYVNMRKINYGLLKLGNKLVNLDRSPFWKESAYTPSRRTIVFILLITLI